MATPARRVGRPAKNVRRVELRLNADDPYTKKLEQDAKARGVSLQQHITDILIALSLQLPMPIAPDESPPDNASAIADQWM